MKTKGKYVAFLRGINVGGHHKVPMADLRQELETLGIENITTILNSGNVIFDAMNADAEKLEKTIAGHLEKTFNFPVPTILRKWESIQALLNHKPFKDIKTTKDTRLYVSFLRANAESDLILPWASADSSFKIIGSIDKTIFSVLDLSVSKTPKAMEALENFFGKDITTRNWNTIEKLNKILNAAL
jgi:uncharacterized protein (DUF1697 family)